MGSVGGQGDHVERQRETLNADPTRLSLNQRLAGSADAVADVKTRFEETGITPRKNAVLAIDVFITASPEHFASNHPDDPNWKAFQQKAMDFLKTEYGEGNVVHAVAHHDETSPHLHAIITPICTKTVKVGRKIKTERTENRLTAHEWLGGDRTVLSKLQTRFADSVKELGLHRGVTGSKADHTEVKQFYSVMKETTAQAQAINLNLAPIDPDHYKKSVGAPKTIDKLYTHDYAKYEVGEAVKSVLGHIEQTNANADIARRGQLVKLQTPATDALIEKGRTRQSQAEKALEKLGYRLDEHGQTVNILQERKNALRATISHAVSNCASWEELKSGAKEKGVRIRLSDGLSDEHFRGRQFRAIMFDDGKGTINGADLGESFRMAAILQQLNDTARRKEQERADQAAAEARRVADKLAADEARKLPKVAKPAPVQRSKGPKH